MSQKIPEPIHSRRLFDGVDVLRGRLVRRILSVSISLASCDIALLSSSRLFGVGVVDAGRLFVDFSAMEATCTSLVGKALVQLPNNMLLLCEP